MAELETSCCTSAAQSECCEPEAKDGCCAPGSPSCACEAGEGDEAVREQVRRRYAAAALAARDGGCCGSEVALTDEHGREVFGRSLYMEAGEDSPDAAGASLGCGVPTAVADLAEGETVLDLGSGAGADVLISARRVGPSGRAIGLDMTDEMLALARRNAEEAGVRNVEFRKGYTRRSRLPMRASTW